MGWRLAPLALSEEERSELKAFAMRRKTAQALAEGADCAGLRGWPPEQGHMGRKRVHEWP